MSASTIEWTDVTWNPVTGCTRVSPGCANCYIERTPPFRMNGRRFAMIGNESTTGVQLHADRLDQPLHWRKPRRVFVCSLADLFHEDVPDEYLRTVFAVMASAGDHTFQVLTKRPERMRDFFARHQWRAGMLFWPAPSGRNDLLHHVLVPNDLADPGGIALADDWVPPNVWLGTSIENARYTWRADVLREIPAAVRFISAEPLLGSLFKGPRSHDVVETVPNGFGGETYAVRGHQPLDLTGISWVIIGGESGPGARPFLLDHAREIIAHAALYALDDPTAVFVKQLGARPIELSGSMCAERRREQPLKLASAKGGDPDEWPADLRIREFPASLAEAAA